MVTHLNTNPPVPCLYRAERMGSLAVSRTITRRSLNFAVFGSTVARLLQRKKVDGDQSFGAPLGVWESLIQVPIGSARGLAYEWSSRLLYFLSS